MRLALLALALLPSAAFAITISDPDGSKYWVQNTSNPITWTYTSGDPPTVDIVITNSNNMTLNGNFSIARSVPVSQETFIVTEVSLRVGSNYKVVFLDTTETQVIAQSAEFEVKAPGTSPAPTANPSSTNPQGTASGASSGSGTASGSAASSSSSSSKKSNAALGLAFDARGLFSACGIVAFGTSFL